LKTYYTFPETERAIARASLYLGNSFEPFVLSLGNSGTGGFQTGVSISGISGYIFDPSGNFVGGYAPLRTQKAEIHIHSGVRASLFLKDVLVGNNYALGVSPINAVEFDKPTGSFVDFNLQYSVVPIFTP